MFDSEKIIKAIECRANANGQQGCIVGWDVNCPYAFNHVFCDMNQILLDALTLLREQQNDINNLNETIKNLLQNIANGEYKEQVDWDYKAHENIY